MQPVDYLNPTVTPLPEPTNGGNYKTDVYTDPGHVGQAAPFTDPGQLDYLNPTVEPMKPQSDGGNYKTDIVPPAKTGSKMPNGNQGPYKTDIKP